MGIPGGKAKGWRETPPREHSGRNIAQPEAYLGAGMLDWACPSLSRRLGVNFPEASLVPSLQVQMTPHRG